MANLQEETLKQFKKHEYNKEPVFYCKRCLSLKIFKVPKSEDLDYCDDCGGPIIEKGSIEEWEQKYKAMYGHTLLETY